METHEVVFRNLVDVRTGEPVVLEIPNSLKHKAGMRAAGAAGERAGQHVLSVLNSPELK